MCNKYRRTVSIDQIRAEFADLGIPVRFPEGAPNLAAADICITDQGTIVRSGLEDGQAELVQRRWSWPGPTGKPVFNFRSEGREFTSGRCLIVADGFYEYTDPKPVEGRPKRRGKDHWLFTRPGGELFCIAGIWRSHEEAGEAFTMLTTEPGPDVAPYHDRQVVVLDRKDWARWLDPAWPASDLLHPSPAGSLAARQVRLALPLHPD